MGSETKIQWTDYTFNPWIGCTKVSPGCTNCYAEARDIRFHDGAHWGKGAPRSRTTASNWRLPLAWNREAAGAGVRKRVFCASLADVFDAEVEKEWRLDLFELIANCPHLDWQLLTKRPENAVAMLPPSWLRHPMPNVWLGTTVEDQERAQLRIPWLLDTPAAKRFLSVEPQLGPVDLTDVEITKSGGPNGVRVALDCLRGHVKGPDDMLPEKIDWVIVGGESGHGAREFDLAWARSIIQQCKAAGVPVFCKQIGVRPVEEAEGFHGPGHFHLRINNHKGGDMAEWPADLRVREFPR